MGFASKIFSAVLLGELAFTGVLCACSELSSRRHAMVDRQIAAQGVSDARVLAALRRVPRHLFVPPELEQLAYSDGPLPIPGGQTISQPYIVAFMTEAADISPSARCLEIGTGSGYQAAVLAELCGQTHSIEYLPEVAAFGRANLDRAGYLGRVELRVGDGYGGWPERAPFDVIIVTAAPEEVPKPLLAQLSVGGKLVIPVGPDGGRQRLERWTRIRPGAAEDAFDRQTLLSVQFVPFLGPGAG
jgi:protein-L-isoaspartate(D-aspartate) O-methyltransferase